MGPRLALWALLLLAFLVVASKGGPWWKFPAGPGEDVGKNDPSTALRMTMDKEKRLAWVRSG